MSGRAPRPTARAVAARVIERVVDEGAYASRALDGELSRAQLSARDAALASQIVYGTLRRVPSIDAILDEYLRDPSRLDPRTRAILRISAYQLVALDRVPAHAVVHEAVSLARSGRGEHLARLVNAVLRRVAARPAESDVPGWLPSWLVEALHRSLGEAGARRFCGERPSPPALGLRARRSADALVDALRAAAPNAVITRGEVAPSAVLARHAGDPRHLPGYDEGEFAVQEEGSQALAAMVGVLPDERICDACAGHGGKTLAMFAGEPGLARLAALDLHEAKLERIAGEARRLRLPAERIEVQPVDLTVGVAGLEGAFDRVLVDAPCSGIGTLHRRPELALRLRPGDVTRLAALQARILENASQLVRRGGVVVYAVCSPLEEEGRAVVDLVRPRVGLELVDAPPPLPHLEEIGGGGLRLGTAPTPADPPDAYQVFRLRRI